MEGKRKISVIILILIILLVMSFMLGSLLIMLSISKSKTKVERIGKSGSEISNSYATTEVTGNTWDVSANGDGSVMATLLDDDTLTIYGNGEMKNWSTSLSVAWYNVSSEIKKVIIENGVTNIGNYAFYTCRNLASIEIPNSITGIGNSAFYDCRNLTNIKIPNSVTNIGNYAFESCAKLTSIDVDEDNVNYKDDNGVLYTKDGIQIIKYPEGKLGTEYTILSGTTNIENRAFNNCTNLTNIEISSSVTSIGDWAFYSCTSLTSIEISSSVTSIGYWAFYNCTSLTNIEISNSVTSIGDNAFNGCKITKLMDVNNSVELPDILKRTQDENDILYSSSGFELTNCTIANNYIGIEDKDSIAKIKVVSGKLHGLTYLVYNNTWYISETENDNVVASLADDGTLTISGTGAMKNWSSNSSVAWYSMRSKIKKVMMKNGVTTIGNYAFYYCYDLMNIEIPRTVTSIGYNAFESCDNLTSIKVDENNTSYKDDNGVLYTKDGSQIMKYPKGKLGTEYTILNGTTNIENRAFNNCTNLTNIEIPSSVTSIEEWAFYYCTKLTSIEVDENNISYKDDNGVLYTKNGTQIIKYPEGKTEKEYLILTGTTNIRNDAFYNCRNLTSIEIPSSVTSIGESAFYNCTKLTSIEVDEDNISYKDDNGVLYIKDGTQIIKYPEGKTEKEYMILTGTTNIKNHTFSNCTNLTNIEIPNSVTSIGHYAFSNCINLTSIEIPSSVTNIGDRAFNGCEITKLRNKNNSIELPDILKRTQDENDILYSSSGFELTNCTIENNYIKIEDKDSVAKIEVISGKLYGLTYLIYNNVWDISANESDNVVASLAEDGALTISGTGAMRNWSGFSPSAWFSVSSKIKKVIIENGVTMIGKYAFYYCYDLMNIEIPRTVTSIGYNAFYCCKSLTRIIIPNNVEIIEDNAFYGCDNLTMICYKDSTAHKYAKEYDINYLVIMDGIQPKTAVKQIEQEIVSESEYKITDKNGEIITDASYITTGCKVEILDGENYIILVTGDCNGDGQADFKDILQINKHRLNIDSLTVEYLLASDVNKDGITDIKDILQINKYRLGKISEL